MILKRHLIVNTISPTQRTSLLGGVVAVLLACGSGAAAQEDFAALKAELKNGIEQQPEAQVIKLLQAGLAQNQPAQAAAVTEAWLKQNLPKDPKLLYLLARSCELSGDWREAAAAYQQFLANGDVKSAEASDAVTAVFNLLVKQLNDNDSAYSFSRREASRLSVNPRFRQYDQWFLNEARTRNDLQGTAERLVAIAKSGVSTDHLQVFHQDDLIWLIDALHAVRLDQRPSSINEEVVKATRELADTKGFDEELRLLAAWKAASRFYCLERIEGKEINAPLDLAKQLITKFPHVAAEVQMDWVGGNNGIHYRDDPQKYWPHQLEGKLPPIQEAIGKLGELPRFQLLETWSTDYYSKRPAVVGPEDARKLTLNSPQLVNHRLGPKLEFGFRWGQLEMEQAKALSANLERNPSPEAAMIRTIALAGEGKDLDRMIDHLIKHESWRLNERHFNHVFPDQLWEWAGKPGGNPKRDQAIKRFTELRKNLIDEKKIQAMPADQRLQEFRKYWQDFKSPAPKLAGVDDMVFRYAKYSAQAVEEILKDDSLEARYLACRLIDGRLYEGNRELHDYRAGVLSTSRYAPYFPKVGELNRGMEWFKENMKEQYRPHPLLPALSAKLERQVKAKQPESWLVMAWLNAQFPDHHEQAAALAQQVVKTPGWDKLPARVHDAMQRQFPSAVLNQGQQQLANSAQSQVVCKALLELQPESSAAQAVQALQATADAILKAPRRVSIQGLSQLGALSDEVWADAGFHAALADMISDTRLSVIDLDNNFATKLQGVANKGDAEFLLQTAAYLWMNVERHHRLFSEVKALANRMTDKNPEVASALARMGLQVIERHRGGHTWFKAEEDVPLLKSIRGKTALKMGLVEIPVAPNHPHYPVHLAQAEWMTENHDSAWKLVDGNWEVLQSIQRELSLSFLMWILDRSIQTRDSDRQEQLIKSLLAWTTEPTSSLRNAEKGAIEIAYGDIAVQRGQLREAAEIFSRIQKSETYQDLPVRHEAALRRVRVDRLAKNFDGALQLLTELEMERIPGLWLPIRFARAEVHFDMEEYDDCRDDIDSILAREPNHADAKILLGKVQLKNQKLMEATEVEIGSASSQQKLVPGERLKVTLTDPTLAVSGAGAEIEVVVWAESGDREQFFLRQFGDQKTKFRGEVATSLGAPKPDDGILQVIGDDQVFYAYSERFREKMVGLEEKRGGPITIASDAVLMASARKLLSEAEQRRADMQAVMEEISGKQDRDKPTNLEGAAKARLATEAIQMSMNEPGVDPSLRSAELSISQVAKPGNPIHVRVVDPDRSRTAEIDELTVSVASSSGDTINRVVLKETETHSGWFEGSIPTTGASARAMAPNSEPGRNPNMVISAKADYPAWRPVTGRGNMPELTVDLNDRVELGELTLTAAEEGFKLRKFLVQTAPRHGAWTTVAIHPQQKVLADNPWRPSVTVISESGNNHHYGARDVTELRELRELMSHGWMDKPELAIGMNVTGPTAAFPTAVVKDVKWLRSGRWENPAVVYRFQAHFHERERVERHFRFDLGAHNPAKSGIGADKKQLEAKPQFLLLVDGKPLGEVGDRVLSGQISLSPGVHTIELWATGWLSHIGFGRQPTLQTRTNEELPWEDCPEQMFDPREFPPGSYDHRNRPAEITALDEGRAFKLNFARGSETRLLRFLFLDNEGPVPAINKIALSDSKGQAVLPLKDDYAELNKNQVLEILTGDRIFVRYQDDRFITPSKERQERFLDVSFTDAHIEFADMEPRFDERKNEIDEYYERLLRFRHGKPIDLAIRDADMDVSVQPDTVPVTISTGEGKSLTMTATETGDSTGIFRLRLIPVTDNPTKDNHVQVAEGGIITARYLDQENNRPGVPTERVTSIEHAQYATPAFVLGDSRVSPWQPEEGKTAMRTLVHGFEPRMLLEEEGRDSRMADERIQPRWQIEHVLTPAERFNEKECQAVLGQYLYVELHAPQYILGVHSSVKVFAQTESGRRNSPKTDKPFDTSVRGTVQLPATLIPIDMRYHNDWRQCEPIASYVSHSPWPGNIWDRTYDRFYLVVPLIAGVLPEHGVLSEEEMEDMARLSVDSRSAKEIMADTRLLVTQPGETIHIGFEYTDREGKSQWITARASAITHPVFDIMSEDYRDPVTSAYAGEQLHLRVVDLGADLSDENDTVTILMQAKSGAKYPAVLTESGPHTGIFKADIKLSYNQDPSQLPEQLDVVREGFPITYGDTVAARYTDANGINTDILQVTISKGADGLISPFSKKYEDEEIAMRTQFSLAEAYLEMAKRHRLLGQADIADLEYNNAKQLLAKAMDQFTDPETRAHAEYLLGTLTMEEADTATDPEIKETRFRAALSRFMNVTGTYPDSLHASRAQYRIATVYEKLGEPEIAAQEYVKLAYKYPDSEYLATSMAKLGSHFLKKAAAYEAQAKPLLARAEEDADAAFEGQALQKMAEREYLKTASIFSRLQERFPDNRLAGKSGLHAGQAYMRAKKWREAISMFQRVFNEEHYDGPEERAPAIFWSAMCYQELRQEMAAYSAYKRLTYDFPESKWAGYARAKLSEERLLQMEEKIEIERLEAGK